MEENDKKERIGILDKELAISKQGDEIQIALIEDKRLVELHKTPSVAPYMVGDICFGKIKKIMQGLNAAFVDIGGEKEGFFHYVDLGLYYNSVDLYLHRAMNGDEAMQTLKGFEVQPILPKDGLLTDLFKVGQPVLMQVSKEPISTKGPKVTGDISLAGHYLVLTPFCNKISVSQKIRSNQERSRLKRLMQSICPEGFGVIVRTVAEGKTVAELDSDLRVLLDGWAKMTEKLKHVAFPQKVHTEQSSVVAELRDVLSDEFSTVYVDDEEIYNEVVGYVRSVMPEKVDIVRQYKLSTPIFEQLGVQRDIRRAFGRIVSIRSGVYLYIEHTEAMHVIDVNSGNHIKAGSGQEDTALQVNIESAKEIARQLRLRDMGGIVIVDFIDMDKAENRKILFDVMHEAMKMDKARHTILPLSKFGLMQITRQRVRPSVEIDVQEKCPMCDGTGHIKQSLVVVDEIESNVNYLANTLNLKRFSITLHPYIYAYLTKGWIKSVVSKWQKKYKVKINAQQSEQYGLLEYRFFYDNGEEVTM